VAVLMLLAGPFQAWSGLFMQSDSVGLEVPDDTATGVARVLTLPEALGSIVTVSVDLKLTPKPGFQAFPG
jgi:hypothetical protein